ncbi:MAG: hypothetical protein CMJ78_05405 [Planctomycetaceae bacterium]|nr:hypothetical protein [Planctomycetaceae bacterium]
MTAESHKTPVPTVEAFLQELKNPDQQLGDLLRDWHNLSSESKKNNRELYIELSGRLLKRNEPILTLDVTEEGLEAFEDDLKLQYHRGLALARSGAAHKANALFQELMRGGNIDLDIMTGLARSYKDLWQLATNPAEKSRYLDESLNYYRAAYTVSRDWYRGINVATLLCFKGSNDESKRLAEDIYNMCKADFVDGQPPDYWCMATLGEASLLRGMWEEAADWYSQAVTTAGQDFGSIETMHRQAKILIQYVAPPFKDREQIEEGFILPTIVVFVGHMIDTPGRTQPRFPAILEQSVSKAIHERLSKNKYIVGYASAACGSDILFHEAIYDLKGDSNVILPYDEETFPERSVDFPDANIWRPRYENVLRRAKSKLVVSPQQKLPRGSIQYDYANRILTGLAAIRAQQHETRIKGMAVWNGEGGDGPNGTASLINRWKSDQRLDVDIIPIQEILAREMPSAKIEVSTADGSKPQNVSTSPNTEDDDGNVIASLLFADINGFSKLNDEQIPWFVEHVLGTVGNLLNDTDDKPMFKNTWGDGLYMVFDDVGKAGRFALELNDRLSQQDWVELGLPEDMNIRIALHAGPVFRCHDPVTERINYTGSHVSYAARIEPVTPEGQVYASQAFAALASHQCIDGFITEYVGQTPLAKGYGTFPTYHVRPRRPEEACLL